MYRTVSQWDIFEILWVIDYLPIGWSNTIKSLLSKSTFSIGIHQTQSKIIVDENSLIQNGINFGVSIPLLILDQLSVNFGVEFGKLGDLTINKIEENYIKFSIGFSLA